ncbi:MAG: electron transfer flavoprotein subunit alpha/FixB family protein [Bacteroidaceae bacterium]|nr:electron transfer flavoprotein subunit alpha/FixB family protein [Bacteroidaceae bacterium]MBR6805539.1 electron transfer flavoprotein subunit alpha/FixB family protein [Bacteroidaceae bacterium]
MNNILVYCELDATRVAEVSLELLSKGRELADRLGVKLEAVALGANLQSVSSQVFPYGVDRLHLFADERLSPYTTQPHTSVLCKLIEEEKPQILLLGATVIGRDLAPRVSSTLGSGLTADCTALEIGDYEDKKSGTKIDNLLYSIRPAFGGNIVATIVNPHHRPQMSTVREGVMPLAKCRPDTYEGEVINHKVQDYVSDADFVVSILERHVQAQENNLKSASVVVAGGYGMGSKENFDMLFTLAHLLHGEVGATRAAIDAGYTTHDRQIGQTGITVRPKVYIACGISGQVQHISGMQDSSIIISVNSDPDAPINAIADYVVTGTVEEVIPKIINYYQQK